MDRLKENWEAIGRIIPYGCGVEAKKRLRRIMEEFTVPFIIDRDKEKWRDTFAGIPIVSDECLKDLKPGDKIVVTIARRNYRAYNQIKNLFARYGLEEDRDYCHISTFCTEWYRRFRREYCLFDVDITLTTKCTLRCRNCNMFIRHYKENVIYRFEDIKKNLDLLLSRTDYVVSMGFLGGEALLNPDIEEILRYVHVNYRDKVGTISVITNGINIPERKRLKAIKDTESILVISDYTPAVKSLSRVKEIEEMLVEEGVSYGIMRDRVWCHTGFPEEPWDMPEENVRRHMMECGGWRGLNDGKLYFCNIAWSAEKAGLFRLRRGDYIDLVVLPENEEETKRKIFEFAVDGMENGYMSFCRVCGGCGPDNRKFVLAGEQIQESMM